MTKNNTLPLDMSAEADGPQRLDRRAVLNGAAGLVAFAGVAAGGLQSAKAADKAAQADVDYQDTPNNGVNCAGCQFYDGDGGCEVVEGEISADGWCAIWSGG